MTTVSALPPSTAPAKAGAGKTKSATEGGDDFATMLAGMTGTATPAAAPVTPENGAPAGGLPGAPVPPLVLDLSQLDATTTVAQAIPVVLPAQLAGQPAVEAPAVPAAPVVAPTMPAQAGADAAPIVPAAAVQAAAVTTPDAAAAVTAVTTPTTGAETAAAPAAGQATPEPITAPTGVVTSQAAAAVTDAATDAATPTATPTAAAATAETVEPATPTSLQAPAATGEAEADADVQPTGQETARDAGGEQADAPLPQSAPAPADAVRSSAPAATEGFGPTPVTENRSVAAPAAPAPAAPTAPPPATQVITQLAPVLEGPDGAYTMSLQLYPEELGMVQVEVSLRGGEISLALHTSDEASKELLRGALAQLREQLEATGLTATDVSVDSGASDERDPATPQRSGTRGGGPEGESAADSAPALTTDPDAALDVRI